MQFRVSHDQLFLGYIDCTLVRCVFNPLVKSRSTDVLQQMLDDYYQHGISNVVSGDTYLEEPLFKEAPNFIDELMIRLQEKGFVFE